MTTSAHRTEGVNRTKTVRFHPFVFTGEVPCKEVRTPLNSITFNEERDEGTCYGYCDDYQPHAVKRMFDYKNEMLYDLRWDEAGNLGQVSMSKPEEMFEAGRFLFWTEDNRMHAAVDDKYYSYYAYDHSGERRLKLTGDNKLLDVNADFMATYTILNEPTLYPSAYMVLTNKGYTKHYYAGTERVAARLGGGGLDALGHDIGNNNTIQTKANLLFDQSLEQVNNRILYENDLDCIMHNDFAKEEFGHWIDGIPYQMQAGVELNHDQFKDMVNSMLDDINHGQEKEVYFYHSDHLGSASWITDFSGVAVQHIQYLPYGEPYINQHPFGYSERFTFTGKERDEETGYGYFGARYMDHELMTMWLSVDPMAVKYPSISPYAYCAWNPVKLVDPNGKEVDNPPYSGSGWGHSIRRFLYNKLGLSNNVNNVVEAGINSMFQSGEVNVQGEALEKIKNDPAVGELENDILKTVKSNKNYGEKAFTYKGSQGKQLGGKRAPGNMSDQLKHPLDPKNRDTWAVAFSELTWLVRSVTIEYDVSVSKDGAIDISYSFSDTFDLRPSKGRSDEYNTACKILGYLYHDVCGGNDQMKVNASWGSSYNAKGKKVN